MSLIQVSADLKILRHRQIGRQFTACKSATILAVAKVKQRKPVSGAYGGLPRTYTMLKREVMSEPTITRTTPKQVPRPPQGRVHQGRSTSPNRRVAMNPLLTEAMKK